MASASEFLLTFANAHSFAPFTNRKINFTKRIQQKVQEQQVCLIYLFYVYSTSSPFLTQTESFSYHEKASPSIWRPGKIVPAALYLSEALSALLGREAARIAEVEFPREWEAFPGHRAFPCSPSKKRNGQRAAPVLPSYPGTKYRLPVSLGDIRSPKNWWLHW